MSTPVAAEARKLRRDQQVSRLASRKTKKLLGELAAHAVLIPFAILMLIPLIWLFSTSLKPKGMVFTFPPQWIPNPIRWENYKEALTVLPFHIFFRNTLIIVAGRVSGQVLISSMVAYAFARLRFPGRNFLFWLVLIKMMLPQSVTMVPEYVMFHRMGWVNTFLPLTVPAWLPGWYSSSFYIFLCRQFFMGIPMELDDAAKIDGAGHLRIWWQIIMPLSKPVIVTVAIFSFLIAWNDFQGPLIYIQKMNLRPLALGLQSFQGAFTTEWHWLMAASATMVVPVIFLFFLAQRYFLQGITMSGLTGR